MVQQDVSLDAALGPAKINPREQLQAQRNSGRVERKQLVLLKRNFFLRCPKSFFVAEPVERGVEQILVQLGGSVFVGIREGGFIGRVGNAGDAPVCPRQPRPLQISRRDSAGASRQNSIETNCVQQPKPLAPFSASFFRPALWNFRSREVLGQLIAKRLATCMMALPSLWGRSAKSRAK